MMEDLLANYIMADKIMQKEREKYNKINESAIEFTNKIKKEERKIINKRNKQL